MFNICKKSINWAGRELSLESGKIGRQADGSVIVTYGETVVHCAVCAVKSVPENAEDFFPLTVNYTEKTYAAGKIPGGFFKREAKPSEYETLTSRLIDRPIRPLFADGFRNETQVTCTVLSFDLENSSDIVAMIAASAALTISGVPFMGPIGAARVGYKNGQYMLNPLVSEMEGSELELVVAGTKDGVLMVESKANELSEEVMLKAVTFGHENFMPVIKMIIEFAEECAKDPWQVPAANPLVAEINGKLQGHIRDGVKAAYQITVKKDRHEALAKVKAEAEALFTGDETALKILKSVFHELEKDVVRRAVLETGRRIDGRDTKTVRPIVSEVDLLPRTHGSALFTRGETQVLSVATLGTGDDEQIIDALGGEYKEHFMLHYNFPSFSVGEVKRAGSPGRREIGHGKLAWRALKAMLPEKNDFPYTLRVVAEVMESNGSSSMATVCASSMALMAAGVPMPRPVAGVAMGLIKEADKFTVLTDIMGDEDHLGDMDFKVAGSEKGITALQMDIKITSITPEIMEVALKQAYDGRIHILGEMSKAISTSRGTLNKHAPRVTAIQIHKDKIREVIGTGGKVIREITETTGCQIDISDDGMVKIFSADGASAERALAWIEGIVCEPEVGRIYEGKVVKIMEFGAFVNFLGSRDGLVHVSEIVNERVEKVDQVLKEGQLVKVKLIGTDNRGKIKLSMKRVNQETGEDLEAKG